MSPVRPAISQELDNQSSSQNTNDRKINNSSLNQSVNINSHTARATRTDSRNNSTQSTRKNILILRDTLLNNFDAEKFSYLFNASCINLSSLENAVNQNNIAFIKKLRTKIDCYVIELGINDIRNKSVSDVLSDMEKMIDALISSSSAPVIVCSLLPVLDHVLNLKVA